MLGKKDCNLRNRDANCGVLGVDRQVNQKTSLKRHGRQASTLTLDIATPAFIIFLDPDEKSFAVPMLFRSFASIGGTLGGVSP